MKLYVAGPMSGIPKFNYPAFLGAAEALRDLGHEVLCPAEMDSPEMQELALASETGNFADLEGADETWGDLLSKDVKLVADEVEGLVLLSGWHRSRGARLETYVALTVQKPVFGLTYDIIENEDFLMELPAEMLMREIHLNTLDQGDVSRYG